MIYVLLRTTFLALPLVGLWAASALAAECSGRFTNVNQSAESIDLGDGHTLLVFTAKGSATSENSAHIGTGMCGGYVLTTPDGKTWVTYACARKDANGDSWSDFGGIEPGADKGTWTQSGGTGVFKGKNSSGWWQTTVSDGTVDTGVWGGNCE